MDIILEISFRGILFQKNDYALTMANFHNLINRTLSGVI